MIKKTKVSKKDNSTWQEYLKNPIDIEDKDQFLKKSDLNNKRFKYDLHGYSLDNANKKVRELIFFCLKRKYKEILLITGKGIHSNTSKKDVYASEELSKLRYSVPDYIKTDLEISNHILSVSNADKNDGGEGAIIIRLKSL